MKDSSSTIKIISLTPASHWILADQLKEALYNNNT